MGIVLKKSINFPKSKCLKLGLLIVNLGLVMLLGGCWDSRDLKNVDVVVAIALDYPVATGQQKEITLELLKSNQPLEVGTMNSTRLVTSQGDTILEAISGFYTKGVKELSLPHNRLLVLGSSVGTKNTSDYLDYFVRSYKVRPTTLLVITDTSGKELLGAGESGESGEAGGDYRASYQTLAALAKNGKGEKGLFAVTLQDFIYAEKTQGIEPILPLVKTKSPNLFAGGEIDINSFVVFKDGKSLGELSEEESRGYLWLKNKREIPGISLEITNSLPENSHGGLISVDVVQKKADVQVKEEETGYVLEINLQAKAGIREAAFYQEPNSQEKGLNNQLSAKDLNSLEQEVSKKITQDILVAFKKAQSLNGDFLGLGQIIYAQNPKIWQGLDQGSYLQNLKIKVEVNSKIVFLGDTVVPIIN